MKTYINQYKIFLKDKNIKELEKGLKELLPEVEKEKIITKFHAKCLKLIKKEIRIKKAGGKNKMVLNYIETLFMGFGAMIGIMAIVENIITSKILTPYFVLFWILAPIIFILIFRKGIKKKFSIFFLKTEQ